MCHGATCGCGQMGAWEVLPPDIGRFRMGWCRRPLVCAAGCRFSLRAQRRAIGCRRRAQPTPSGRSIGGLPGRWNQHSVGTARPVAATESRRPRNARKKAKTMEGATARQSGTRLTGEATRPYQPHGSASTSPVERRKTMGQKDGGQKNDASDSGGFLSSIPFSCSGGDRIASRRIQARSDRPAGSAISADQRESAVSFPGDAQRGASVNAFDMFASFAVP